MYRSVSRGNQAIKAVSMYTPWIIYSKSVCFYSNLSLCIFLCVTTGHISTSYVYEKNYGHIYTQYIIIFKFLHYVYYVRMYMIFFTYTYILALVDRLHLILMYFREIATC